MCCCALMMQSSKPSLAFSRSQPRRTARFIPIEGRKRRSRPAGLARARTYLPSNYDVPLR